MMRGDNIRAMMPREYFSENAKERSRRKRGGAQEGIYINFLRLLLRFFVVCFDGVQDREVPTIIITVCVCIFFCIKKTLLFFLFK